MKKEQMNLDGYELEVWRYHTLIIGTGAAGYAAADALYQYKIEDLAIITEHRLAGTSRNTGSDKQTYYKLTLCGEEKDSVRDMAYTLFKGQCVDGDHALCEAALSVQQFYKLVELGVPFPNNRYGEYIGYKTDHDPKQRATSIGPMTSRAMTEALERSVLDKKIPVFDKNQVVEILSDKNRVYGILCLDLENDKSLNKRFRIFISTNIIWATGGPAGMYMDSVYPLSQHGTSGIAFSAGVKGKNLTEWQYGLASIKPRWNVSGTYMQSLPRFFSIDQNGEDEREFLVEYLSNTSDILNSTFLKGYEWPFDIRKTQPGSSMIDLAVYVETVRRNRRVFLDYRNNPNNKKMDFGLLRPEAYEYLKKTKALFGNPFERLYHMNKPAVDFFMRHGVDLSIEPLEIAICAQHNNGGLDVDLWWQTGLEGFFAIGEAAATHGVYRPGGTALNAGQVGAQRAALYISMNSIEKQEEVPDTVMKTLLRSSLKLAAIDRGEKSNVDYYYEYAQKKMSEIAGMVRNKEEIEKYRKGLRKIREEFTSILKIKDDKEVYKIFLLWDMLLSQEVYLSAMLDYLEQGGKSRGSALYNLKLNKKQSSVYNTFFYEKDNLEMDGMVQLISIKGNKCNCEWRKVRPVPEQEDTFENIWRKYLETHNVY